MCVCVCVCYRLCVIGCVYIRLSLSLSFTIVRIMEKYFNPKGEKEGALSNKSLLHKSRTEHVIDPEVYRVTTMDDDSGEEKRVKMKLFGELPVLRRECPPRERVKMLILDVTVLKQPPLGQAFSWNTIRSQIAVTGVTSKNESATFVCNVMPSIIVKMHRKLAQGELNEFRLAFNKKAFFTDSKIQKMRQEEKRRLVMFAITPRHFVRLYFKNHNAVQKAVKMLKGGLVVGNAVRTFPHIYEDKHPLPVHFANYTGVGVGKWCSIWDIAPFTDTDENTDCQLNGNFPVDSVAVWVPDVIPKAEILRLSTDIECIPSIGQGYFPNATYKGDLVTTIGNTIHNCITGNMHQIVLALGNHKDIWKKRRKQLKREREEREKRGNSILSLTVVLFDSEVAMIKFFREVIVRMCDEIITYNGQNFDVPYLVDRSLVHGDPGAKKYCRWPLMDASELIRNASKGQHGKRASRAFHLHGRGHFDVYLASQRIWPKLSSYKLDDVAKVKLPEEERQDSEEGGSQKVEMAYANLFHFFMDDVNLKKRSLVADYCLQDTLLPLKLAVKYEMLTNSIQMSNISWVTLFDLSTKGEQVKVNNCILVACNEDANGVGWYIDYDDLERVRKLTALKHYEGGKVIDPLSAFYEVPIATLDFNSLYPSIMIAHNICPSALVLDEEGRRDVERLKLETTSFAVDPNLTTTVQQGLPGLIPQLLETYLTERKRYKGMRDAALAEGDKFLATVYDGTQLSIKVLCNSVYGYFGVETGYFSCKILSIITTFEGRRMLNATVAFVESHYPKAKVVYGDTDSVMVKFALDESTVTGDAAMTKGQITEARVKLHMDFAKKAAVEITRALFKKPINLAFEKVFLPYLIFGKKKYCGRKFEKDETIRNSYISKTGLDPDRREWCPFVRKQGNANIKALMGDDPVPAVVKNNIELQDRVIAGKIDHSELVLTVPCPKAGYDKNSAQKSVFLQELILQRDPEKVMANRIAYFPFNRPGAPPHHQFEEAEFLVKNQLPINMSWYYVKQLIPTQKRLLHFTGIDVDSMFNRGMSEASRQNMGGIKSIQSFFGVSDEATRKRQRGVEEGQVESARKRQLQKLPLTDAEKKTKRKNAKMLAQPKQRIGNFFPPSGLPTKLQGRDGGGSKKGSV
jgi:DNA polymerase elongation subunit (family B)